MEADKNDRDLTVYLLWQTGRFSNREIGSCLVYHISL